VISPDSASIKRWVRRILYQLYNAQAKDMGNYFIYDGNDAIQERGQQKISIAYSRQ